LNVAALACDAVPPTNMVLIKAMIRNRDLAFPGFFFALFFTVVLVLSFMIIIPVVLDTEYGLVNSLIKS
jgi:hypothetical protein